VPAVTRLQLVGLALIAALLLGGCGDGASETTGAETITARADTTAEKPRRGQTEDTSKSRVPGGNLCQSQLGSFVGALDGLRRRLAVGVTYDQYIAEVEGIRSIYQRIPAKQLRIDCLTAVATPGEKAFNRYIEAANDWGDCVSELGCGSTEVEPVLQRRWRIASHFLSEAKDSLRGDAT
jgi:hypothetical protein